MRPSDADRRRLARAARRRLAGDEPPRPARAPGPTANTWPEQVVADWLARHGVEFEAQAELVPGTAVDFWLPGARLVVECQGTWFHGDGGGPPTAAQARRRAADAALQRWCQAAGIGYHEVWEDELRADPATVWARLAGRLWPAEEHGMAQTERAITLPGGLRLAVRRGNLVTEDSTAIVNAANGHLAHGGGVAGAISRAGGPLIQAESDAWLRAHGPLQAGEVALTGGGELAARAVIHAVGPVWAGGAAGEPEALVAAVTAALDLAQAQGFESVAFPAISSGIFGFPKDRCAELIIGAVVAWDAAHAGGPPAEVRLTNIDAPTTAVFVAEFDRRWPNAGGGQEE